MMTLIQTFTNMAMQNDYLLWKSRKVRSELNVNHLPTLQICKRKLKPYVSKELLIWEIFVFINFQEL